MRTFATPFAVALFALTSSAALAQTVTVRPTTLIAHLDQTVDSTYSRTGDAISAKVTDAALINGTLIPKGAHLRGHLTLVEKPTKVDNAAHISLVFDRIDLPGGRQLAAHISLVGLGKSPSLQIPDPYGSCSSINPGNCAVTPNNGQLFSDPASSHDQPRTYPSRLVPANSPATSGTVSHRREVALERGTRLLLEFHGTVS